MEHGTWDAHLRRHRTRHKWRDYKTHNYHPPDRGKEHEREAKQNRHFFKLMRYLEPNTLEAISTGKKPIQFAKSGSGSLSPVIAPLFALVFPNNFSLPSLASSKVPKSQKEYKSLVLVLVPVCRPKSAKHEKPCLPVMYQSSPPDSTQQWGSLGPKPTDDRCQLLAS